MNFKKSKSFRVEFSPQEVKEMLIAAMIRELDKQQRVKDLTSMDPETVKICIDTFGGVSFTWSGSEQVNQPC